MRQTLQQRHDLRAHVAAMDGQADVLLVKDANRLSNGPHFTVGIAQHANLHQTIPGCSICGALGKRDCPFFLSRGKDAGKVK